jgi:hypothetical protein
MAYRLATGHAARGDVMGERRFGWRALLGAVVVGGVLMGTGVALGGSGTFSDVSPEHPFASDIEAIAAAGITTGYSDGTFRPGDTVTRQAMAAFMGRGFGRAASGVEDDDDLAYDDGVTFNAADATISAGAVGEGTGGYVVVTASASILFETSGECPCSLTVSIRQSGGFAAPESPEMVSTVGNNGAGTFGGATATATHLFPIEAGETLSFQLRATQDNEAGLDDLDVDGSITAVYVPFDGNGNVPAPV